MGKFFQTIPRLAFASKTPFWPLAYTGSPTFVPTGKTVLKSISPTIVAGGGTSPPTINETGWSQGWFDSNGGPRISGISDGSVGANGAVIGATSYSLQALPLNSNSGTYADVTTTGNINSLFYLANPRAAGIDGVTFVWVRLRATNAGGDTYSNPVKQTYVNDSGGG